MALAVTLQEISASISAAESHGLLRMILWNSSRVVAPYFSKPNGSALTSMADQFHSQSLASISLRRDF